MNTGMREPETAASSPNVDWKRARGRVVGCWLSVAGLILAVPFPFPAFIVGVLGLGLSARALNEIPKGEEARRLSIAGTVWGAVAILSVVIPYLVRFAGH